MSASHPIEWTVAQLVQAVVRGQLELHYQPVVDLRSDPASCGKRTATRDKASCSPSLCRRRHSPPLSVNGGPRR
nr:hypothetical protein [Janthinobacterium sp. Marseille]